ncbi:MAG: FAD-dependent oxidoreductase [bacterium]
MAKLKDFYDVIVIGGGCTGTGVARDCSMRGLRTLLVEKRDFAGGTTGACMGMIHGGIRYLLYDVETTRVSCLDSGYIQRIAPHLLFRIPFLTPVMKGDPFNAEMVETFFEAYDRFVHLKRGKKHTRLTREEALEIEPGLSSEITGAVASDEWGINPFRLCVANALDAAGRGADVSNYTETVSIAREGRRVRGVRLRDVLGGGERDVRASIVVNAAGPWAPKVAALAGIAVKLRPTKGINIFFERRITSVAVSADTIDGRNILLMPHENSTMLGCTDDDFYGDLDHLTATHDEIEYLLQAAERVFPSIRSHRIIRVMAGVRPTLYSWRRIEDKLSRDFEVRDHAATDGVEGFISVIGGKLAMYRLMAEKATNLVCAKTGVEAECRTHLEPLTGGGEPPDTEALAAGYSLPLYAVRRLAFRHGANCAEVLKLARGEPRLANLICRCEPVTAAEIVYCVRKEMARTLDDVRRRTNLGCGPCQGARCAFKAAILLARERGDPPGAAREHAAAFLQRRWKGKFPALRGEQLAQEELNQGTYFTAGNLHEALREEDFLRGHRL